MDLFSTTKRRSGAQGVPEAEVFARARVCVCVYLGCVCRTLRVVFWCVCVCMCVCVTCASLIRQRWTCVCVRDVCVPDSTALLALAGNLTELIWMSAREADRYDTYELKHDQPLATQQVTAEVIYKFVIEKSRVRGISGARSISEGPLSPQSTPSTSMHMHTKVTVHHKWVSHIQKEK